MALITASTALWSSASSSQTAPRCASASCDSGTDTPLAGSKNQRTWPLCRPLSPRCELETIRCASLPKVWPCREASASVPSQPEKCNDRETHTKGSSQGPGGECGDDPALAVRGHSRSAWCHQATHYGHLAQRRHPERLLSDLAHSGHIRQYTRGAPALCFQGAHPQRDQSAGRSRCDAQSDLRRALYVSVLVDWHGATEGRGAHRTGLVDRRRHSELARDGPIQSC